MPLFKEFKDCSRFCDTDNGDKKVTRSSYRNHFLPRVYITNYNVLINSRNFYDPPIRDKIKKYAETRKTETGQRDDYTTICLFDSQCFKDHYQLIKQTSFNKTNKRLG